jgi:hypothetical protein
MVRHSILLAGDRVDGQAGPPELRDADYVREVLNGSDGATEADIEQRLISKAAALGIETGRGNTQEQGSQDAGPLDTQRLQGARAGSAGSDGAVGDGTTQQTSDHATATTATAEEAAARRRSRSLSFSQYEKYISQVDPALVQPKLVRPGNDKSEWSAGVVLKSGTKKGVRGFTKSIAAKLRRRRPSPNLPM